MSNEQLDPARTALLFIDFQVDVCGRGGRMVSQDDEVLARFEATRAAAADLLNKARADERPLVVHVAHLFEAGYPELDGAHQTGMVGYMKSKGAFVAGSEGAAIVPELAPADGEVLLRKTSISAFETTDLGVRLQRRGIDTVVICGVVTHYAVLSATFAAADRGFRVIVASDGCTAGDSARHEVALAVAGPLADVWTIAEITQRLSL